MADVDANATFALNGPTSDLLLEASEAFVARGIPEWAFDGRVGIGPCSLCHERPEFIPTCFGGTDANWIVDGHLADTLLVFARTTRFAIGAQAGDEARIHAAAMLRAASSEASSPVPSDGILPGAPPVDAPCSDRSDERADAYDDESREMRAIGSADEAPAVERRLSARLAAARGGDAPAASEMRGSVYGLGVPAAALASAGTALALPQGPSFAGFLDSVASVPKPPRLAGSASASPVSPPPKFSARSPGNDSDDERDDVPRASRRSPLASPASGLRRPPAHRVVDGASAYASSKEDEAISRQQERRASNSRSLAAAASKWRTIRGAMLDRYTEGRPFGSMAHLPGSVLTHMAEAQRHQADMYAACRDSVRRHLATMGPGGAALGDAFSDDISFDACAARVLSESVETLRFPAFELACGVVPVGYAAITVIAAMRPALGGMRVTDLAELARAVSFVDKKGNLDITNGGKAFFKAWNAAVRIDRPFATSEIHHRLMYALEQSAEAKGTDGAGDWRISVKELVDGWVMRTSYDLERHREVRASLRETSRLVQWIISVGAAHASYVARRGFTLRPEGHSARIALADTPGTPELGDSAAPAPAEGSPGAPPITDETTDDGAKAARVGRGARSPPAAQDKRARFTRSERPSRPAGPFDIPPEAWTMSAEDWVAPQHAFARWLHARYQAQGLATPRVPGVPPIGRAPTDPCWTRSCKAHVRPDWCICHCCLELNPRTVRCLGECMPFAGDKCPECDTPHEQCGLISDMPHLAGSAKVAALSRSPFPPCMRFGSEHEPPPPAVRGLAAAFAPASCVLEAHTYVIGNSDPSLLSASALQKNGWGVILPSSADLPASIRIPGVACVTLRPGRRFGEHFLLLAPYVDPLEPGLTSWAPFDPTDPAHGSVIPWELLLDTGASVSIVGTCDASKLARVDRANVPPVTGFNGAKAAVSLEGFIRVVVSPKANATALDYSATMAASCLDDAASGEVVRRIFTSDIVFDRDIATGAIGPIRRIDTELEPEHVPAAHSHAHVRRRSAAFPVLTDPRDISERFNISNREALADFGNLVGGVKMAASIPEVLPIDLLLQLSCGKRPPAHRVKNAISHALAAARRPGDCFYTDLGPRHSPDPQGNRFARLGVDDVTGRGVMSWSDSADTDSLIAHLDDINAFSKRHRGHPVATFCMDFAAEAVHQGRGDNLLTSKLSAWVDRNPGTSIRPNAPYTPQHNKVEPAQGRIHALAFTNHLRAHVGEAGWRYMEEGALFQFNHARGPGDEASTRNERFTGQRLDASSMLGFVGQGGWTHRHSGKASARRVTADACLYIRPSEVANGQIVLLLRNLHLCIVQSMVFVRGNGLVLADLAISSLHGPGGYPIDLDASDHSRHIQRLFAPFTGDTSMGVVQYNAFTGVPMEIRIMTPMWDDDGELRMVSPSHDIGDPALRAPGHGDFIPVPGSAGDVTGSVFPSQFIRLLTPATRIRFDPDGKAPRGAGDPSASRLRYKLYHGADTIAAFHAMHPVASRARADLLNDLRVGLAHIHRDDMPGHIAARVRVDAAAGIAAFRRDALSRPGLDPTQSTLVDLIGDVDGALLQFYQMQNTEGMHDVGGYHDPEAFSVLLVEEAARAINDGEAFVAGYFARTDESIVLPAEPFEVVPHAEHPFGDTAHVLRFPGGTLDDDGDLTQGATACMVTDGRTRPTDDAPKGVLAAEKHRHYEGAKGWRASINKQIRQIEGFGAWRQASDAEYLAARRRIGAHRITLGHILMVFRYKTDGDGFSPLDGGLKGRAAFAQETTLPSDVVTYSSTADDLTDRVFVLMAIILGMLVTTADVTCAYFQGIPTPEDEGGQLSFARVPKWLPRYGDYSERDSKGKQMWLRILGNFPGLATAGPCWQRRYHTFIVSMGMRQGVIDRCAFFYDGERGELILHIHVDDTRIAYNTAVVYEWFMRAWCLEFGAPPPPAELDTNFCGIKRVAHDARTTLLTCGAVIHALSNAVAEHPMIGLEKCDVPMTVSAPRELLRGVGSGSNLAPEFVFLARRLCGMVGFVVSRARPDASLAYCVLSKYMGPRLTHRAWRHLLRLVWYLVKTADMPMVMHHDPSGATDAPVGARKPFLIAGYADSSHGTAREGGAYAGFVISHLSGSPLRPTATLAWKSQVIKGVDSTGAQELAMVTKMYRWILGLRALIRDANFFAEQSATPLYTDAQVVIDQADMERLCKNSRWIACRLAMFRHGSAVGAIGLHKVAGVDNVADMFTKPLQGEVFARMRSSLLGHHHLRAGVPSEPPREGPTWSA